MIDCRSREPGRSPYRLASVVTMFAFIAGCSSYAVLQLPPGNDPGGSTRYVCPATTEGPNGVLLGPCQTDKESDEARWNQSNTTRFILPACPNGYRRIRVAKDGALVECAAPAPVSEEIPVPVVDGGVP